MLIPYLNPVSISKFEIEKYKQLTIGELIYSFSTVTTMTVYICAMCGAEVDVEPGERVQCTKCGSRILMKPRPPALKKKVMAI